MKKYSQAFDYLAGALLVSAVVGLAIGYKKLYLFHIVFAVSCIAYCVKTIRERRLPVFPTRYHAFFIALAFWYALSILWSIEPTYSKVYLFYIITGTALSLWVICWTDNLRRIFLALKIMGVVFAIEVFFSLLEAFTGFRLPVSPFSTISYLFGRQDSLNLFTLKELESLLITPTGFRWNPNNLGIAMSIVLPFSIAHSNKVIKYAGTIAIFVVVVMTGSRISIAACCMIILFYSMVIGLKYFIACLALYAASLFLLSYNANFLNSYVYGKKLYEITSLYHSTLNMLQLDMLLPHDMELGKDQEIIIDDFSESGIVRRQLMLNGLAAFIESKGLGVGGGASVAVQERSPNNVGSKIKSMHNFWLEVLVEGGALGFAILMFLYASLLLKLYVFWRKATAPEIRYLSLSFLMAMLSFLFAAISASTVVYFLPMWLLLGFSVALVNILTHEKNKTSSVG